MSYYIKPYSEPNGRIAMFRVVKRLRDFKPDNGTEYMVFRSKKERQTAMFIDLYCGKDGKLVKLKDRSVLRF